LENQSLPSNEVVANLLYFQKDDIFGKKLGKTCSFYVECSFSAKIHHFCEIKKLRKIKIFFKKLKKKPTM
jgi:hypothetical protein